MEKIFTSDGNSFALNHQSTVPDPGFATTLYDPSVARIAKVTAKLREKREARELEEYEEKEFSEKKKTTLNKYVWEGRDSFLFRVSAYVIQKYLKEIAEDYISISKSADTEFRYDYEKSTVIDIIAQSAFIFDKGKIAIYDTDIRSQTNSLRSEHDISGIVEELKRRIKLENPLRNKNLRALLGTHDLEIKKTPKVTFDRLILDPAMKQDLYDNTIFQLEQLEGSNGLIFYGPPGTGKSLAASAIISEALSRGFSSIYLSSAYPFNRLEDLIEEYLDPCVVVFEDVDSFAFSREEGHNPILADFLQLLNGIGDKKTKTVFIATTNHIEVLDKAVGNRPVRFNRKFEFDLPNNEEIDQLVNLWFTGVDSSLCHNKKFSGAHIQEIYRTATLHSKKEGIEINDAFPYAVEIVGKAFSTKLVTSPGFKV